MSQFADPKQDLHQFSDSVHHSGLENIGEVTWNNSINFMQDPDNWFCKDETILVDSFVEYGAWTREELEAMSLIDLNSLLLQFISGDAIEYLTAWEQGEEHFFRWDEQYGGSFYRDLEEYYYDLS